VKKTPREIYASRRSGRGTDANTGVMFPPAVENYPAVKFMLAEAVATTGVPYVCSLVTNFPFVAFMVTAGAKTWRS